MTELLYKLTNMWKKSICFFWVFVLLLVCEIPYITSIEGLEETPWYQNINYVYVGLWALPAILALGYIFVMRAYMPKAKKGTRGIAFYIVNANEKQYESIRKKFVAPFKKAVDIETSEYSVVLIDDYHSQKYYPLLCASTINDDGRKQAKILKKRRCCVAIFVDCVNGGDGEELFCHMSTNLGVAHQSLPPVIRDFLIKDISTAFSPLREVDIMRLTETPDLSRHSVSMDIICKYIMASTCFHCGDFLGALRLLETIHNRISTKKDLPDAVIPIRNVLSDRIAVCYRVQAQYEYQLYCNDHEDAHLVAVRNSINNVHCKRVYEKDNKVLEGICSFVLDKNIIYAVQCMDAYNKKDAVVKYNKIFLLLYSQCTTKNIGRTYNLYKSFGTLSDYVKQQIEDFTYYEYQKDTSKKQLLLILFFIYDYQNNTILAKRCLDQFCVAFPWIAESEMESIFKELNDKYADIKYEEGEEYSI